MFIHSLKMKHKIYEMLVHRLSTESALGRLEPFSSVCCLVLHQIPAKTSSDKLFETCFMQRTSSNAFKTRGFQCVSSSIC